MARIERATSPLPRECSATELHGQLNLYSSTPKLERVAGIEPASSAWKAEVLPLNYSRPARFANYRKLVEGEGFEPSKAEPSDLQSDPFDRSGTPPVQTADYRTRNAALSMGGSGMVVPAPGFEPGTP